jgi:hypothetical protein
MNQRPPNRGNDPALLRLSPSHRGHGSPALPADPHPRKLKIVPEGPSESSPVRSDGLAVKKGDTSRRDDRNDHILSPADANVHRSSRRDGRIKKRQPSTSYWATFIASLRDGPTLYSTPRHFVPGYFHCVPPGRTHPIIPRPGTLRTALFSTNPSGTIPPVRARQTPISGTDREGNAECGLRNVECTSGRRTEEMIPLC